MKQLLQGSVLQLSVNNETLPVCSEHEKYTAALRAQLYFYSSAVPVTGEEASKGWKAEPKGCYSSNLIQSFQKSTPFTLCCLSVGVSSQYEHRKK